MAAVLLCLKCRDLLSLTHNAEYSRSAFCTNPLHSTPPVLHLYLLAIEHIAFCSALHTIGFRCRHRFTEMNNSMSFILGAFLKETNSLSPGYLESPELCAGNESKGVCPRKRCVPIGSTVLVELG